MSKFLMTPPNVVANEDMSKESIWLIPLLPLMIPSQVSGTVLAMDVTAPNPVITTRRLLNVVYRRKSRNEDERERIENSVGTCHFLIVQNFTG